MLEKHTDENSQNFENIRKALQTAKDQKFKPINAAYARRVHDALQGEWEYTNYGANFEVLFEGYNITVTSGVGDYSIQNKGTYIVCEDFILITYKTGSKAAMEYSYDQGEFSFYPIVGLDE